MKTQGKVWLFFDSETKAQSKPLSLVQAQAYLLTLNPLELNKFLLWTPGWTGWLGLPEFLQSEQQYFMMISPPKLSTEETVTATHGSHTAKDVENPYTKVTLGEALKSLDEHYGYYHRDFNGDDLDLKIINKSKNSHRRAPSDRRKSTRHDFKIEVVIVTNARSFRTYSLDMSLSGTMLEDDVPKDFLNQPFDLIIVNPFERDLGKARLLFRAKIVGDLNDPRRLMFVEQDTTMTARLDALLKAYVAYQNQMRKAAV